MKWKWNNKPNFMQVIIAIVALAMYGFMGTKILDAIAAQFNCTKPVFYDGLRMLGFGTATSPVATFNCTGTTGATGTLLNGTMSSTGLVGVLFIVAAASVIILAFGRLSFR